MFIPDEFSNAINLMTNVKSQIIALNNPLPSLGEILGKLFGSVGSWLKSLLMTLLVLLAILISFWNF